MAGVAQRPDGELPSQLYPYELKRRRRRRRRIEGNGTSCCTRLLFFSYPC